MAELRLNKAEHRGQPSFRKLVTLCLTMALSLPLARDQRTKLPDRTPLPARVAAVRYHPLSLPAARLAPLRLRGAWRVQVDDRRFAGLSALVADRRGLTALSDWGEVIRLPRPGEGSTVLLRDLPQGPGPPTFKKYRDSESLAAGANGWWVTFEYRHSLWHYSPNWRAGREVASFRRFRWPVNSGVEAVVRTSAGRWLLIPESGRFVMEPTAGGFGRWPLSGARGGIADATRLPDGRIVVAVRQIGWGIVNRLAWLERAGKGFRLRPFATLPLGLFDNVEGLAAEPLPAGATRLWAVTDNDGWRRTLLLQMELPAPGKRERAGR